LDYVIFVFGIIPHYLPEKTIDPIMHYFGDNEYKTLKWEEYLKKIKET
jgi:thioredoxin-related protein